MKPINEVLGPPGRTFHYLPEDHPLIPYEVGGKTMMELQQEWDARLKQPATSKAEPDRLLESSAGFSFSGVALAPRSRTMIPAFRASVLFWDEPAPSFLVKKGDLIGRGREHEATLFDTREEAEKASVANSLWQQATVEIQEVDRSPRIRAQMKAHLEAAEALAAQIGISLDWKTTERI